MDTLFNVGHDRNVGRTERIISGLAGSLLLLNSLRKGKPISGLSVGGYLLFRGVTGYCPVKERLSGNKLANELHKVNIKTTVIINKPHQEVYKFWRKLENLPLFMKHLESVTVIDQKRSVWKAKIPGGLGTIEWESEIVHDNMNERIGWQSLPGSQIMNSGNVQFRDAGNNKTELYAIISYEAPGGIVGESVGRLLSPVFEKMVHSDIEGFKDYVESKSPAPSMSATNHH
jgi:uncharacterized membrane protein